MIPYDELSAAQRAAAHQAFRDDLFGTDPRAYAYRFAESGVTRQRTTPAPKQRRAKPNPAIVVYGEPGPLPPAVIDILARFWVEYFDKQGVSI